MALEIQDVNHALSILRGRKTPKKKSQPRLCGICGSKAIGKYFVEQSDDNVGGWWRVCNDCADMVESQGFEVERYKYAKQNTETSVNESSCDHRWEKHSLVTQDGGYDVMRCTKCPAMGKRFGLGPDVIFDN